MYFFHLIFFFFSILSAVTRNAFGLTIDVYIFGCVRKNFSRQKLRSNQKLRENFAVANFVQSVRCDPLFIIFFFLIFLIIFKITEKNKKKKTVVFISICDTVDYSYLSRESVKKKKKKDLKHLP